MKKIYYVSLLTILFAINQIFSAPTISFTFDDPNTSDTPLLNWQDRNAKILNTLKKHNITAALFVSGKNVNNHNGALLLRSWDSAGHLICNHTFSHAYYPSPKISIEAYFTDILKCDSMINVYKNYTRLFRFPYLKEGATAEKRDGMRQLLESAGYKNGAVTIDASDWYIDGEMTKALNENLNADLTPYKKYFIKHILERAEFYNKLAFDITGREITHTLLLHHSLLNSLFLDDLILAIKAKGWNVANASEAYKDSIFDSKPDVLPAGESLIWSLAKQSGKYEDKLRYPAEDGEYEAEGLKTFINAK